MPPWKMLWLWPHSCGVQVIAMALLAENVAYIADEMSA